MSDDLISRQAVIEAVHHTIYEYFDAVEANEESIPLTYNDRKLLDLNKDISTRIKDLPTADVMEVVRCKDCVHHKNAPKTTDVWCERIDGLLPQDWSCADGERREDD